MTMIMHVSCDATARITRPFAWPVGAQHPFLVGPGPSHMVHLLTGTTTSITCSSSARRLASYFFPESFATGPHARKNTMDGHGRGRSGRRLRRSCQPPTDTACRALPTLPDTRTALSLGSRLSLLSSAPPAIPPPHLICQVHDENHTCPLICLFLLITTQK